MVCNQIELDGLSAIATVAHASLSKEDIKMVDEYLLVDQHMVDGVLLLVWLDEYRS